jgi:hypothetical protein
MVGPLRSGSTILTSALGASPGYFAAGELGNLWRWTADGGRCACGQSLRDCSIWSSVLSESIGRDPSDAQLQRLATLRDRAISKQGAIRRLLRLEPHAEYLEARRALYDAVAKVSGAAVIVDSTKHGLDALVLRKDERLRFLILDRDSRAVVTSEMAQRKSRHGVADWELPPTRSAWPSFVSWWLVTATGKLLATCERRRSLALRYEDFCRDAVDTLDRVSRLSGVPVDVPVKDGCIDLPAISGHQCSGNPARFAIGRVRIEEDLRWKQELPRLLAIVFRVLGAAVRHRSGRS